MHLFGDLVYCQESANLPDNTQTMKKALQRDANSSKAEPNFFAPLQTPFPGGAVQPKFNQLEMFTTFTYRPSLVKIDACNLELS